MSESPRRTTSSRRLMIILILLVIIVGAGYIYYRQHATKTEQTAGSMNSKPGAAAPVLVDTTRQKNVGVTVKTLGTLSANATVTVTSRIDGQLMALHFTDGQYVEKGQLLAELDTRGYQATRSQYQGQLAQDQAQLDSARKTLTRNQTLFDKGALSRQDLDNQVATVDRYIGAIKSDRAQIEAATLNIGYGRITSPMSGYAGLHLIDVGNMVRASDTSGIVTLTQTDPMALTFNLPEAYLQQVLDVLRQNRKLPVTVMDTFGKRVLAQGEVSYISNQIDVSTGSVKLKALLPNPENRLFPNQSVNVSVQIGELNNAVVVPTAAIQWSDRGNFVYVVDDQNVVHRRNITTGAATDQGETAVLEGMTAGERVVLRGIDRLTNGGEVSPITQDQSTESSGGQ